MKQIPKVIHYCWFGGKPIPNDVKKNIESWKKYCPGFEVKEWNEKNFNLASCDYVKEASSKKKWAFVSDYARFWILYNYGGVYFDTDVELIKPIDRILNNGPFIGREKSIQNKYKREIESQILLKINREKDKKNVNRFNINKVEYAINPGLGIGAYPKMEFYKKMLDLYKQSKFILDDGIINPATIVDYATVIAKINGLDVTTDSMGVISMTNEKILVYPTYVFNPIDYNTEKMNINDDTIAIHHYSASWLNKYQRMEKRISTFLINHNVRNDNLIRLVTLPIRIISKIDSMGIKKTVTIYLSKLNIK